MLDIKIADPSEINFAVEWAAREGWNPGLNDATCYHSADPEGFLIGYLDEEPIAVISAVKYGKGFGFIGFYIVKEAYRGQGYGIQIWNVAMETMSGRNVGLDGVIDQQENYRKSGFKLAYRNIRYEGVTGGSIQQPGGLVDLSTQPFESINSYDRPFFPDDRSAFIQSWINQPDCVARGILENGRLDGYGVIRPCRSGYKIGPLFADTPDQAASLFHVLKSSVRPDQPLFLDTPEINQAAVSLAEKEDMKVVFETARMYTGDILEIPLEKIFGVTSFEVG